MEKKFYSFPSIVKYRDVVKSIQHQSHYIGLDEMSQPMYDDTRIKPVLMFDITTKIHGTNATVIVYPDLMVQAQTRNRVITFGNSGWGEYVQLNKQMFINFRQQLIDLGHINDADTIQIGGEWCGQGIQVGVAVSQLPKMFVLFSVKIITDVDGDNYLKKEQIETLINHDNKCWNIYEFHHDTIEIDFNKPEEYVDIFNKMVQDVENECPVGKHFGVDGIGEGLVLKGTFNNSRVWFKIKGEKHKKGGGKKDRKAKTNVALTPEVITERKALVAHLTVNRLEQMLESAKLEGKGTSKGEVGYMIGWMRNDIIKEESDFLIANNVTFKDIGTFVADTVRQYYFNYLSTDF